MIAVTGAGGFVGAALVSHLRGLGWPVVAFRRGTEPRFAQQECFADLAHRAHLAALVEQGFRADVIVHLAGRVEIALQPDPAQPTTGCRPGQVAVEPLYSANVVGTANVVDLAHACGARKIIFASSQTVYGYGEHGRADEQTLLCPLEHYAASKVCAERLLKTSSHSGLAVVILRFPGVFSPQRTSGAVHALCRAAVKQRVILLQPDCAIPFDVLALDDLLPAFAAAIEYEGESLEVFNLSTGEPCSLERLAERIAALVPGTRIEKRGVPQPTFQMSAERAARLLHWQPAPLAHRLTEVLSVLQL
ncbi:MAG: NAD(P)-dependent oxidoreductase [Opitutae bacterium]|nr:NAD(P)-dependent oxidoreductase [Opitutae bacterium]